MEQALAPVLQHLDDADPGEIIGVYLCGSAVAGGRRPSSDIDLLVLVRRSLTHDERESLTRVLLRGSRGRPLEVTCVVVGPDGRRPEPAAHDYQFGEWLRADIEAGQTPQSTIDPDVPILLATAQTAHRVLRGRPLAEAVDPVPRAVLREAMLAIIPDVLEEIVGDERNTLLALARIVTTLRTGEIVPKDVAAASVAATVGPSERALLERARAGYLGESADDWAGLDDAVTALSHSLAAQARQLATDDAIE